MTQADDDLVCYLKEEKNLEWAQISDHFPGRSSGSLQVRYCQRLSKRKNRLNEEEKKRFRQLHKAEEANLWTRLGRAFKMTAEQARVLGRELLNEDEEDPVGESREGLSRQ